MRKLFLILSLLAAGALAACSGDTSAVAPDASSSKKDAGGCANPCGSQCCTSDESCNTTTNSCCTPNCNNKQCGDDGCGGTCGSFSGLCPAGQTCTTGFQCCTPSCSNKVCGDDGCGGSCTPGCTGTMNCQNGQCSSTCSDQCGTQCCDPSTQTCVSLACCTTTQVCSTAGGNVCCGSGQSCTAGACCPVAQVCNGACCAAGQTCVGNACCPSGQGCNGVCCGQGQTCTNGTCTGTCGNACTPCCTGTDQCINASCCPASRSCNGTCCSATQTCQNNTCQGGTCTPTTACSATLNCSSDSCGTSCGSCSVGQTCSSTTAGTPGSCSSGCSTPLCGTQCCAASQTCQTDSTDGSQFCCTTPCTKSGGTATCCNSAESCISGTGCAYATAGTVTKSGSGYKLPPAWTVTDATVLKPDGSGANAASYMYALTLLQVATTARNGDYGAPDGGPADVCPLTDTYNGKTYCDGYDAVDGSGNSVVVDGYDGVGDTCGCKSNDGGCFNAIPRDGTKATSTIGIWMDNWDGTTDTFVLEIIDCAGVTGSLGYTGSTTAPVTTDIATLANGTITKYAQVSVHGVVTSAWGPSSTGSFGFTMQDPGGGPKSALYVTRPAATKSTASVPKMGDLVLVTGTVTASGPKNGPVSITIHL